MYEDRRDNLEKLDDAGLVTDLVFEKYREALNALPTGLVDQIVEAFNAEEKPPARRRANPPIE